MDLALKDKVTVITGGSSGIGCATAELFAREGARVVIAARRPDVLADAARTIGEKTGQKVDHVVVDVTKVADLDALVARVRGTYGRLDVLINNAGTGTYKPFLDVTDEELVYGMEINFFAQFRLIQRFAPLMIESGGGSIVNVTGETAIRVTQPPFRSSCTGPAKAAEVRLSRILGAELGPHNIRVNAVVPGLIHTPERFAKWEREMAGRELDEAAAQAVRDEWGAGISLPGNRWGTPEDVADLVAWAASERAGFVQGATLVVDGGDDKS
ncbi:SDR family NAD(P)-dependent oxidoreductase [Amycolatopsis sp. NPDC051903]|uniref:SDR family NAD(P)-dependent oxidoreductase n=1 Tax=Amycolatopsis sp. NPDC051903 TaxID=3363936 RepID=UPI0037AAC3B8